MPPVVSKLLSFHVSRVTYPFTFELALAPSMFAEYVRAVLEGALLSGQECETDKVLRVQVFHSEMKGVDSSVAYGST